MDQHHITRWQHNLLISKIGSDNSSQFSLDELRSPYIQTSFLKLELGPVKGGANFAFLLQLSWLEAEVAMLLVYT